MTAPMQATRPVLSTAFTLSGMLVLGLSDNTVPMVSAESGLWAFQALRSALGVPVLIGLSLVGFGTLLPRAIGPVMARNFFTATALLIYFGCLAFLPLGVVVAGLFTAPIFVLVISVLFRGLKVGPWRWLAVAAGFAGALMVVWPEEGGLTALALLPIVAGLFYAVGAVATRAWCEGESTVALTAGYFLILGLYGCAGMAALALWPVPAPPGPEGWLLRGAVPQDGALVFWTGVQALGSVLGVAFLTRGYQLGEASFVAVNEYSLLVFATVFAWAIWGQTVGPLALAGMALIVGSGAVIALRSRAS